MSHDKIAGSMSEGLNNCPEGAEYLAKTAIRKIKMTDPRIEAAIDAVIKEKPLYYNQEGKDRLTKALLDSLPKLVLDGITSNPADIGYSFSVQLRYEQS